MREWVPVYAEALGAKPPRRVPVWLAKLVVGSVANNAVVARRLEREGEAGAGLAAAPRELAAGFREALG